MRAYVTCIAVMMATTLPAHAGLFEDLYRGATVLARPSGSPLGGTVGGGLSNGQRFGRVRIVPNEFGQGWRFEFNRAFGSDSFGRPEIFDFGNYELELTGNLAATGQVTTRGIPTFSYDVNGGALNYSLRAKSGLQDVELSGTLNVLQTGEVNPFGFYDIQFNMSNTNSELLLQGVVADGGVDTDWDAGPISIRGNVYVDVVAAALASLGVDVSIASEIFPASPIDRVVEEIQATFAQQTKILGSRLTDAVASDDPAAALAPVALVDLGLDTSRAFGPVGAAVTHTGPSGQIPEPSGALLLLFGAAVAARFRR